MIAASPPVSAVRRATSILLVALLFGGAWIASAEPPAASPAPQAAQDLNVMSFNIRYGTARDGDNAWELRRSALIETIDAFRPDVLGVQEALHFQLDELVVAMPRYQRIGVGRTDGVKAGEYAAILIDRSRLDVLEGATFWFSDTPGVPGSTSWGNDITRICTWARLRDRASGGSFYVYNVHWDHRSQPSRERSGALLLQTIIGRGFGEDPVIVTGDFNAGETNPAFRQLLEAPKALLVDTFRLIHPMAGEVGTFNGFEGATSGEKIDAVLASGGWEVVAAQIDRAARQGRYPSDHFPVTATLTLR